MKSSKKLQDEMSRSLQKPRTLDEDREIFVRFKKGLEWKDESLVKNCVDCGTRFTMVTRKHHCRECGDVFCSSCSSHQIVIHGALKRCCTSCYRRVVAESNQSIIGNQQGRDYDDDISEQHFMTAGEGGGGSFASSNRSPSFAKAVHMVETWRDPQSESPSKEGSKSASTKSSAMGQPSMGERVEKDTSMPSFPPWVEALVYIAEEGDEEDFDDVEGRGSGMNGDGASNRIERRCVVYPPAALPPHVVEDIVASALPPGPVTLSGHADESSADMTGLDEEMEGEEESGRSAHLPFLSQQFMIRVHDKSEGGLVGVPSSPGSGGGSGGGGKARRLHNITSTATTTPSPTQSSPRGNSNSSSSNSNSSSSIRFGQPRICTSTVFYNGFVCYRAVRSKCGGSSSTSSSTSTSGGGGGDGERLLRKHALVLVSKWPFPALAYYALRKLEVTFHWSQVPWDIDTTTTTTSSSSSGGSGSSTLNSVLTSTTSSGAPPATATATATATISTSTRLQAAVEAMNDIMKKGYAEFASLPGAKEKRAGEMIEVNYLGEQLRYRIPVDILPVRV